jgi:hypothetical protein
MKWEGHACMKEKMHTKFCFENVMEKEHLEK